MAEYVTFGEIMLRLKAPGHERFFQSPYLEATFGGSEANVAVALANFGLNTAFVSALPDNEIGESAIRELRRFGVDVTQINRSGGRLGVYYLEAGANQRPSKVVYDRAGASMSIARPGDFDWPAIFHGAKWFHITGITPALSVSAADLTLEAVTAAKRAGVTVSCDLNFRAKLWKYGKSAPEVMAELMRHVDVGIANEENCERCLGISLGIDGAAGKRDAARCEALSEKVLAQYPGMALIALTVREPHSADHNGWAACLHDSEAFIMSRHYEITDIIDSVGGGDSFAAGLIYGLQTHDDRRHALEFAVAASCLKHSIPGDFNQVAVAEVVRLMGGDASGRVQR